MQDKVLDMLPLEVVGWRVRELLEAMGLRHSDVARVEIYPRSVRVEVAVTDADGRRVTETEMRTEADTGRVVNVLVGPRVRVLEFAIRQVWERPDEVDPDPKDRSLEDREQTMAGIDATEDYRVEMAAKRECGAVGPEGLSCERSPGHDRNIQTPYHTAHDYTGALHQW